LRIVFAGTTPNAVTVLRYLVETAKHEVLAVLTREDARVGRKQTIASSAVAEYAELAGLEVIRANRVDQSVDQQIDALRPDLGIVVAYGALLKKPTLDIPKHGWINVHFSLLPNLRGAAPVQHALISGQRETGVTIFQLDQGMDTGPIHSQVPSLIEPDENAGDLLTRLTNISTTMLDECLARIDAGITAPSAQVGEPTLAPKLSRSDARADFSRSALEIENLVRGCNPEPMAWAELNSEPFRILAARAFADISDHLHDLAIGTVSAVDGLILVQTGKGVLQLLEVQPASKRVMSASDWYRGSSQGVRLS
jgi:methionyl-tRNA formyltransferase